MGRWQGDGGGRIVPNCHQQERSLSERRILATSAFGGVRRYRPERSGSLWEAPHIIKRYHAVPNSPKFAVMALSATERPLNIDQVK